MSKKTCVICQLKNNKLHQKILLDKGTCVKHKNDLRGVVGIIA